MTPHVANRRPAIAALCARFHVQRLDVFGSAARGTDFGPEPVVDLIATHHPAHTPPSLADFLSLREGMAALFGHDVDLLVDGPIEKPYLRASIAEPADAAWTVTPQNQSEPAGAYGMSCATACPPSRSPAGWSWPQQTKFRSDRRRAMRLSTFRSPHRAWAMREVWAHHRAGPLSVNASLMLLTGEPIA
jgi:predicted nucleotidyltransferase